MIHMNTQANSADSLHMLSTFAQRLAFFQYLTTISNLLLSEFVRDLEKWRKHTYLLGQSPSAEIRLGGQSKAQPICGRVQVSAGFCGSGKRMNQRTNCECKRTDQITQIDDMPFNYLTEF
jgi:hypothetical protein